MTARRRLLGALIGLSFGEGIWQTYAGMSPEADVERWRLRASSVPIETAALNGELRRDPRALDLSFYQGASPWLPSFTQGKITVNARVPTDGQLRVYLGENLDHAGPGAPQQQGEPGPGGPGIPPRAPVKPGRPVAHGGGPGGPGGPAGPGGPPGGGGPASGAAGEEGPRELPAGFERMPGGAFPGGATRGGVGSVLIDRSARASISSPDMACSPRTAPAPAEDEFTLGLNAQGAQLDVSINGEAVMRCEAVHRGGAVLFGAGVRRIQLQEVRVEVPGQPVFEDNFSGLSRSIGAQVGLAALGAVLGVLGLARRRSWLIATAPLLLAAPLFRLDMRALLDDLRLIHVSEAAGPALLVGVPTLTMLLAVVSAGLRLPHTLGVAAAVAALLVGGVGSTEPGAILLAALAVPWALLTWVNTHPVPARPLISWALCAVLAVQAELGLRQAASFSTWATGRGWERARGEFAQLLEIRQHKAYPSDSFPVRPPDPDPTKRRIVALGGSSTGGAYQMDDLDQFWPNRLGEALAARGHNDWEVVNQGVGGWNTLHVRLYVESQIQRLDADIFVVYVGHNDILTRSPAPYRDLYARYQRGSGAAAAISTRLSELRLYNGLRFMLLGLRDGGGAVAVPVEDARENLTALFSLAEANNIKVMLLTEGLNPDPQPMGQYAQMQRELAESRGGLYLDTATLLWQTGDPNLFLDDCHLSQSGHVQLSGWIADALEGSGWL
ncbi:SGNH/GDSL hydrolase family protein [Myxococcota bacterium]|nr:SGNH/GDSL hydrolase family protein [Myxococcota bacterium]